MAVMLITAEHKGNSSTDPNKQLSLSNSMATQHEEQKNTPYASNFTNALGSYNNTVTILTDNYNLRVDSTAMGETIVRVIEGGEWRASKGSLYGMYPGDFIKGAVLSSKLASRFDLAVRMKKACDGLQAYTTGCKIG